MSDKQRWFAVYPGSEKLDIGPKHPVALVEFEAHGELLIKAFWPGIGYMEPMWVRVEMKERENG